MTSSKTNYTCRFLSLLSTCEGDFNPDACNYTKDFFKCLWYEPIGHTGKSGKITPRIKLDDTVKVDNQELETVMDYADRMKRELTSMGIKYEELGSEPIAPDWF